MKYKVLQMRGGAPDKIQLYHHENINLLHCDFRNLVDYQFNEIYKLIKEGYYLLPADEGDIKYANSLLGYLIFHRIDQSNILLPQTIKDPGNEVIDYNSIVPKDSEVYRNLEKFTGVKYPEFKSYSIEEFKEINLNPNNPIAYKTTTGSGSRGVLLIDPDRVKLGGKYRSILTNDDLDEFMKFANKENCKIMMQELIPNDLRLMKINVDFVIRNGKLLGYKWDKVNPDEVFTNWNFGWFVRNEYTELTMHSIVNYLTKEVGIYNAIMNFEAYSDNVSETWMIEFNWRYSNSMFEWSAVDIDPIYQYLTNQSFINAIPFGIYKFSRYWQCKLYNDIENYMV